MKKIILVFFSITIFIMASTSMEVYENKVSYYEKLMDNARDNSELRQVALEFNNFLTKDIDATYKYLLSRAGDNQELKNAFIATQEEWKKLRDKEFKFIELAFANNGSMAGYLISFKKAEFLKSRLVALINLIYVDGEVTGVF